MKKNNTLLSGLLSLSIAVVSFGATSAHAEFSGALGITSMYLWRGLDVSGSVPAVSGGLNFKHSSGFYASTWTSSESPADLPIISGTTTDSAGPGIHSHSFLVEQTSNNSYEQDIWVGFSKEFSGVGIDVSLWEILYPQSADKLFDTDGQELAISGSYMGASLTFVLNLDFDGSKDYKYLSADYKYKSIGVHAATTLTSESTLNYSDFNISYGLTDAASVKISMAVGEALTDAQKNPLVLFSYEIPLDLK